MRRRLIATAAALVLVAGCARGESTQGAAVSDLDAEWRQVQRRLPGGPPPFLWQRHSTPPLPLAWPPTRDTGWVRYEYAYGFDPVRTADAIRVAAPWARVQLDRDGQPREARLLETAGAELGLQGVFPTHPPSGAIDGEQVRREEARALQLTVLPAPGSREQAGLAAFYGQWLQRNGVIAAAVRDAHEPFFAWIERAR